MKIHQGMGTAPRRTGARVGALSLVAGLLLGLCGSLLAQAQVNVTTALGDIGRTGQNRSETILTTSNVNPTTFGKLFAQSVDGAIYAQPLYLSALTVNGAVHNVVFVATQHDSVYAFDADNTSGANASPLWMASMLTSAHGAAAGATPQAGNQDIAGEIGITGTPVIDPVSGTLYVVSKTVEGGASVLRLHALDVTTGAEKFGGPATITANVPGSGSGSVSGNVPFLPLYENQRPGLLLLGGSVYIGFASHVDGRPWHGWVFSYDAGTLRQTSVFCTTPNGNGGGIWMSGTGLAADQLDPTGHPNGRMFPPTGNGDFTATKPYDSTTMGYGDSVLTLDLTNGAPTVVDDFTPSNQAYFDQQDIDVGAGGVLILPTQTAGAHPHLLVQAGKSGTLYLLDRDNLGGYSTTTENVVQSSSTAVGQLWSSPAYWNGNVYYAGQQDHLKSFPLANGLLTLTSPTMSTETFAWPGATPSVSSNGNTQGIVWTIDTGAYSFGPAILTAHDATNVATTLYSSSSSGQRDVPGQAVKFAVPTVANGKVYIGTAHELNVYGLLGGGAQAAAPVFSPASQSFTGSLSVSITDSTANSTIYYTTDGSAATTSSNIYVGPISVTSTETIKAIATASGMATSSQTSATYTSTLPAAATPTFTPAAGTYSAAQSVTISDTTAGATIYYTTDGSTPTTSSTLYSGAITVSASATVKAIAAASGYSNSAIASAFYAIGSSAAVNYASGFTSTGLTFNGGSTVTGTALVITDGGTNEARSAWYATPVNIQKFTTDFTFLQSPANADGMTFTIQNAGPTAVGNQGGSLGYETIGSSVAAKFDLYSNAGEGPDSTGFYTNGAVPNLPSVDMSSSGVNLHSGDTMAAHLVYDGTTLTLTITDQVTSASFTTSTAINIPATVGGNTAYVGFTGGTGGLTATQKILTWTFTSTAGTPAAATPTFTPAAGTFSTAQSVTISDTTSGATIYYTTDGTTPTTSSSVYSGAIPVSATTTVKAIATASGFTASPVGSATYTLTQPAVATPTFTPAAGTYSAAQSVTISDATSGATIYYTTDGSTPTTSSTVYSGAITVSASATVKAIAAASGYSNSAIASAFYAIGTTGAVNYSSGFTSTGLTFNGGSTVTAAALVVTDGGTNEARSAWYSTPVNIQKFTTDFTFLQNPSTADGFTFTIQNAGPTAVGNQGGSLGYETIGSSVAAKFDLYSNAGEGPDSTGFYTNGAVPNLPSVDMSGSGVNLHSGDTMAAHLVYDGTTLTLTITDQVTSASFTTSTAINIPATVGGNTAYVGFTGGTGGLTATQKILTWTFTSTAGTPTAATPTFTPAAGTYTAAQSVTISDTTAGATIYYTTDGSTPTTSSAVYSGAITVGSTTTVKAIAAASGYTTSAAGSATYTLTQPAVATPTFTPAAGTYSATQSVTISDTTAGATIYYTTDGSTPTTSSAVYSGAITVSATKTVNAIAAASGYSTSAVASATYTIAQPVAATPTFTPAAGTYTATQSVTISDTTAGATIYYTTDGTTPTTSSTVYSGAITVSASATVKAIAAASGYSNSAVATAVYAIGASGAVNYSSGFTSTGLTFNGGSTVTGTALVVTDGGSNEARSAWYSTPVNIQKFTTDFTFLQSPANADGMTFTIQNAGPTAVGNQGGSLGYETIGSSVAAKFDLYSNAGEGPDSTGFYTNGAVPNLPSVDMSSSGVNLHSGDTMAAHLVYDGTTLTLTITDQVTSASFTTSTAINIPATVGGNTAYVGFTGGTGGLTATQKILTWTFTSTAGTPAAATPTFTPAAGTYTAAQSVTISDTTAGATIYYTTDGSTPTTSSAVYAGAIPVSVTTTVKAIAAASGYTTSTVASAAYTMTQPTAATPTFTPAAGTYSAAQSVTISDATSGATIYYTTDGTTPTTSSTVYTGAIAVSATKTVKAIAAASGYTASAVATATYTIGQSVAATPTFTPAAGTYTATQSVTISDTTAGATIYYTTDGTTPTTSSTAYTGAITVSATKTVKALAAASGYTNSAVASATYTITLPTAATPTFSPAAGTYTATQSVKISDTTTGATIYYTTDGTTPTTSSTVYTGAISVSATKTLKALAAASGYTNSAVASAKYTITQPTAATPTFSPAAGTYTATQSVKISDTTTGATIYYTTDGTTPTTSSTVYSGAISLSTSATLKALAVASGYSNSAVGTANYGIGTASSVSYAGGFTNSGLIFNGGSTVTGTALVVTDGGANEARSAWYSTPVNIQKFTTDFTFVQNPATADGFTFAIQNAGPTAVGNGGGGLGFEMIGTSVAAKFDLYSNAGEGPDSTGFYVNGAVPNLPSVDMSSSGVNLHSGDTMAAHLVYDGTTLTLTITDQVTSASFTTSTAINIPSTVGGTSAYVGFTGGTGGATATQKILTWTYAAGP